MGSEGRQRIGALEIAAWLSPRHPQDR